MKLRKLSLLIVAAVLLGGCSSTNFTAYHGSDVFQGTGGARHIVDGIYFWEDGDSDRKYMILGLIKESHKHVSLPGGLNRLVPDSGDNESAIAKVARQKGADAVVVLSADRETSDTDQEGGQRHRRSRKFLLIKFADEPKAN